MKTRMQELFDLDGRTLKSLLLKMSDGSELLYLTNENTKVELKAKENGQLVIYSDVEYGEIRTVDIDGYLTPTIIDIFDDGNHLERHTKDEEKYRHPLEPYVIDWEGIDEDGNEI